MGYLTIDTITGSWESLSSKGIKDPFWGLLQIFFAVKRNGYGTIHPSEQYKISGKILSERLQSLFYFGEESEYSDSDYWVLLSKKWNDEVLHRLAANQRVSAVDISIICLYNEFFDESEQSIPGLIDKFKSLYGFEDDSLASLTVIPDSHAMIFVDEKPSRGDILTSLQSRLNIPNGKLSLSFQKPYFKEAKPSELSRGSYIQPLYGSKGIAKCLLFQDFSFFDQYGITKGINAREVSKEDEHIGPKNWIIFGPTGTGKSTFIKKALDGIIKNKNQLCRVTFHPDYTYSEFVGAFRPSPKYRNDSTIEFLGSDYLPLPKEEKNKYPTIDYKFVPGPLMIALRDALNDPSEPVFLIIEELNRGNASAMFGDFFQLLDRDSSGNSIFAIKSNGDAIRYLTQTTSLPFEDGICFPENLYIWSTVNPADQNVFPLDTAFKRRWDWHYIPIDYEDPSLIGKTILWRGSELKWLDFLLVLNGSISTISGITDDKLLGQFFLNPRDLHNQDKIKNKLLLYLWEDIVPHSPSDLFYSEINTFYQLINKYEDFEEPIFQKSIEDSLYSLRN